MRTGTERESVVGALKGPVRFPLSRWWSGLYSSKHTHDVIWDAVAHAIDAFTPLECANYFTAAGYEPE